MKIENFIVLKFENNNSFFLNFLFTSLFDLPSCKYGTLYPFDKRPTHSLKMRTYFRYADAVCCFRRQTCVSDVELVAILCSYIALNFGPNRIWLLNFALCFVFIVFRLCFIKEAKVILKVNCWFNVAAFLITFSFKFYSDTFRVCL